MKKYLYLFLGFLLLIATASAEENIIPDRPYPSKLVNNLSKQFPDFLSSQEQQFLENKLSTFNDSTSNQIAIVIVDDLGPYDANDFGVKLFNKWGIGQKEYNNGILILIKPTGNTNERVAYIVVGYGLEGIIPDITAKQIVEKEILPFFRQQKYFEGLNSATSVIMSLAKGEYNYSQYGKNKVKPMPSSFLFLILLLIVLFFILKRKNRGYIIGGRGMYYGGGWHTGGSNWGGSFGGFGGFGGGRSGGGGAGGSW